ncbi:MAG: OsmC family protein [Flavobacteriales bacterium]
MNPGMTVIYKGDLRNEATHMRSGNQLITDAPTDNQGKGEAFSPTDLLCTSLAACMTTIMAITAQSKGIQLGTIEARIEKVMYAEPRRVGEIHIEIRLEDCAYGVREKSILEQAAHTCPVAKSLHPDIKQVVTFSYC